MNVIRMKLIAMIGMCWLALSSPTARADLRSKAATELAETLMAKFGARAGKSVPALAQRIEGLAARHGDEAVVALRKVGPSAFGMVEAAGSDGAKAVRVLAQHGEAGATRVVSRPKAMSQFLRYGDEAASVLVRHPGVAEGLVERGGINAVKALGAVTPRNGRRVAMLLEGELANTAKHPELLEVIAKYGDRGATFVWENKGSLAVGTALAAFLLHPEPFINGTKDITKIAGENILRPIAEIPGEAVKGVASGTNWTVIILVVLVGSVLFVLACRQNWCARILVWLSTPPTAATEIRKSEPQVNKPEGQS